MTDRTERATPAIPAATTPEPSPTAAAEAPAAPKKRKRKYSRNLGAVQEAERAASKAAERVAGAVEKGLSTYRKKRDRSAGKKRDGALRDFAGNASRGMAKTLREASRAPADLAKALDSRPLRKLMRRGVRLMMSPFSR